MIAKRPWTALGLAALCACGDGGADFAPASPTPAGSDTVFDTSVLHEIDIAVSARHLAELDSESGRRVPGTLVFDGTTFPLVGIRRKGTLNSRVPLSEKPSLSIKLNEFYGRLRFTDLDKLLLNNGRQDGAFLYEHLGFELYRRAGVPAPRTAHAVVTFNGEPRGIYVIREPIDKQFLERHFGPGASRGNLYEGSCIYDDPCTDFLKVPEQMELKRELRENRSRADLHALIAILKDTRDESWERTVREHLDLDRFLTSYAIDALSMHWDGYAFNANNYYLFRDPADGRFTFIPHGMDSLFGWDALYGRSGDWTRPAPLDRPRGLLAQWTWVTPPLRAKYVAALRRVMRDVWDERLLAERIEQVGRVLHSTDRTDPRTLEDLRQFDHQSRFVREFVELRRSVLPPELAQAPPGPG